MSETRTDPSARSTTPSDDGLTSDLLGPEPGEIPRPLAPLLFQTTSDGLALVSSDLRILRINPALGRMLGGRTAESRGRPLADVFPGCPGLMAEARECLEGAPRRRTLSLSAPGAERRLEAECHLIPELAAACVMLVVRDRSGEEAAVRARTLAELTARLTEARTEEQAAEGLLEVREGAGASGVAVFLPQPHARGLRLAAHRGFPEPLIEMYRTFPAEERLPATDACRTGTPVYLRSIADARARYPDVFPDPALPLRAGAWAALPLQAGGAARGCLVLRFTGPRAFATLDRQYLDAIAGAGGQALLRIALERRAQAADRAKSGFLGILSHELRTPLAAILGTVDLLETGSGPAALEDRLVRIRRSAWHLSEILGDMLILSRADLSRDALEPRAADLARLVRDVAAMVEPEVEAKGLTMDVCATGPLITITEPALLRQVLLNVAGNAVKFTPQGKVRLSLRQEECEAVLEVADTGIGIQPDDRPRIFEPFWQADQSDSRRTIGVGLGLAVAQRLLVLLDGRAEIRDNDGGGTVVSIRIPMRPPSR